MHMAGGTSIPARKAFAENLLEKQLGREAEAIRPLEKLDGVVGYSFDLVPLRQSLITQQQRRLQVDIIISYPTFYPPSEIIPCRFTYHQTPRLINSTKSPHEILKLITTIGIDLFDAQS